MRSVDLNQLSARKGPIHQRSDAVRIRWTGLAECSCPSASAELGEVRLHPLQTFVDVGVRHGVGETDVVVGAERLAGYRDHIRFMQQSRGQFGGAA